MRRRRHAEWCLEAWLAAEYQGPIGLSYSLFDDLGVKGRVRRTCIQLEEQSNGVLSFVLHVTVPTVSYLRMSILFLWLLITDHSKE